MPLAMWCALGVLAGYAFVRVLFWEDPAEEAIAQIEASLREFGDVLLSLPLPHLVPAAAPAAPEVPRGE